MERLKNYAALIEKWNRTINLVAKDEDLWSRHIWDSYQLVKWIPSTAKSLVDLGSGAGLPGIVLACALPIEIVLAERDQRKASFLREAARILGLDKVKVRVENVEELTGKYDVVTARALAPLDELCALAEPLMGTNAICLFPKGRNFASEVGQARESWQFDCQPIPSLTQEDASVVSLSKLKKRG